MRTHVERLCDQLTEIANLEDSYYKSRAYSNAVLTLSELDDEELITREDFRDLYGIGESINAKIFEFLETGIITKLQTLRAEGSEYLDPKYYKVRKGFITRKLHIDSARLLLYSITKELPAKNEILIAGSFRREKEYVGDFDVLVHRDDYENVISVLSEKYEVISSGEYKSQFLVDTINNVPMDVIVYDEGDKYFQLLYLTGSREMNIRMRYEAAIRNWTLNQYGLFYKGTEDLVISDVTDEKEIFKALCMDYIEPKNR